MALLTKLPGRLLRQDWLFTGDLQPSVGESRRSHTLRVGRYAQHFVDALSMDDTPVEYLLNRYPESKLRAEQMRAQLGNPAFPTTPSELYRYPTSRHARLFCRACSVVFLISARFCIQTLMKVTRGVSVDNRCGHVQSFFCPEPAVHQVPEQSPWFPAKASLTLHSPGICLFIFRQLAVHAEHNISMAV